MLWEQEKTYFVCKFSFRIVDTWKARYTLYLKIYLKALNKVEHQKLIDILKSISTRKQHLRITSNLFWNYSSTISIHHEESDIIITREQVRNSPDFDKGKTRSKRLPFLLVQFKFHLHNPFLLLLPILDVYW